MDANQKNNNGYSPRMQAFIKSLEIKEKGFEIELDDERYLVVTKKEAEERRESNKIKWLDGASSDGCLYLNSVNTGLMANCKEEIAVQIVGDEAYYTFLLH